MWFESLLGFPEQNPDQVRSQCYLDGDHLVSRVNGRRILVGEFETPTLHELRDRGLPEPNSGTLSLAEEVADVQQLHRDKHNAGAVFQVASQFNLLEMVGPGTTPEQGVGIYEQDRTQGPACAIAAGGGTVFRNYFVPVGDQIGQTEHHQIDCLAEIGSFLGNQDESLWKMRNGYALPDAVGLGKVNRFLEEASEEEKDQLRGKLRVGIHWNVEVTLENSGNEVAQVYGSAMPVSYSPIPAREWEPLARLILEASYEATFRAVLIQGPSGKKRSSLYLTLLGGGAFGNQLNWILDAIQRSGELFRDQDLRVHIVSYRSSRPEVQNLIGKLNKLH